MSACANEAMNSDTSQQNGAEHPEDESIVARMAHLPMVALVLSRLTEAYQKTKTQHELLKAALEKGEEAVLTSFNVAAGIAHKTGLEKPIHMADVTACHILDKVEEKLPIITKTPDEIVEETKKLYDQTVRPRIDQLTHMKDSTVQKYNEAKEYGTTTVKTVLNAPNATVGWGISSADSLVDRLLPETRQANGQLENGNPDAGSAEQARLLTEKLRSRLMARIEDNVQTAQLLAQSIQLVDALKNTSAVTSLNQLWEQVSRISGTIPLGEVTFANVEQQTLTLVKNLTAQLKDTLEASRQQLVRYLPQPLTDKVHQVTDTASDIFLQVREARSLNDISQPLIEQVNGYVTTVNTTMHSALETLSETYLLKWLVPEYHNIGSLDIHMH